MLNVPRTNIVDSHHKVLPAWAAYRSKLGCSPRLITLDHHTDTSRPFRRLIAKLHGRGLSESQFNSIQESHLDEIVFSKPHSVEEAVKKLNNDEHIIAAIKANIISTACVVAHNAVSTDLHTFKEHRVICHPVPEVENISGAMKPNHNLVLESAFLDQALSSFDEILTQAGQPKLFSEEYILDIDLDYFNTFKSISPDCTKTIKLLIENAGLITVATEPDYVKACAIDAGLTSEYLLQKLKELYGLN